MEGRNLTKKSELSSYQVPIYLKQEAITTLELLKPCVLSRCLHEGDRKEPQRLKSACDIIETSCNQGDPADDSREGWRGRQ